MTAKQQQAFSFIAMHPGCSIRELAEHCCITHQSAYERIGQLKRDGLITTGDKHQKRRMKVTAPPL
jgi:DNA-binding MarR family transcriptional regulator